MTILSLSTSGMAVLIPMRASLLTLAILLTPAFAQTAVPSTTPSVASPDFGPVQLTAAEDHQRLLDMLHINELRPGVSQNGQSTHPVNWDESKANPWPNLPDPLLLNNGNPVKTAKLWWTERRPQLVEIFDREILGRVPANVPVVHWEVVSTTQGADHGIATITKHLVGHVDNSGYPAITVNIVADLILPASVHGSIPVVMELNGGYPAGYPVPPPRPVVTAAAPRPAAPEIGPPIQQQVLAKGWGFALLYHGTFQADNGAGLTQGIIGLCNHGQPRKLQDWGVLRAWAWGASRLMDYLETDPSVDAHHVAIEGHSRRGKAALVAMAYEPRFSVAYISSSGAGGANLARRRYGEQIENIAGTGEYHWMGGNYLKYAALSPKEVTPADMPVDMHELIALCAPRPILIDGGTLEGGDGWADTRGTFIAEVAAEPVYRLLGKKPLGNDSGPTDAFPPVGTPLLAGDLAFVQHSGGHNPQPSFATFLTFATRYMAPAASAKASSRKSY